MKAEAAMAKIITLDLVPTDHLGIGSRAVFRRVGGEERYEMTFLGPWEADPARGRFNYQAPLAQKLMGLKIGDVVEFDHGGVSGSFELVELHNALADHAVV
jgi:transcription elongation factor GreA